MEGVEYGIVGVIVHNQCHALLNRLVPEGVVVAEQWDIAQYIAGNQFIAFGTDEAELRIRRARNGTHWVVAYWFIAWQQRRPANVEQAVRVFDALGAINIEPFTTYDQIHPIVARVAAMT